VEICCDEHFEQAVVRASLAKVISQVINTDHENLYIKYHVNASVHRCRVS